MILYEHHNLLWQNPFLNFDTNENADIKCEQGFGLNRFWSKIATWPSANYTEM